MRKARVLAVCTVGLVLALLVVNGPKVDQTQAAVAAVTQQDVAFVKQPVLGESQGVVLDLAWATTWTINGNKAVFLPVPHTDVSWQPQAINPMKPDKRLVLPENFIRRSLWFMPIGEKMLWGTLVDSRPLLVFVERLTEDDYRITVKTLQGDTIIATEGTLRRLDEQSGYGVIESKQGSGTFAVVEGGCSLKCNLRCSGFLFTLLCACDLECKLECPSPEP